MVWVFADNKLIGSSACGQLIVMGMIIFRYIALHNYTIYSCFIYFALCQYNYKTNF